MKKAVDREVGHIPVPIDFEQQFTDLSGNILETSNYREMWWDCYAPLLSTNGLCKAIRK
jgi:hypothetical protein